MTISTENSRPDAPRRQFLDVAREGFLFLAVGGATTLANLVLYSGLVYLVHMPPAWAAGLSFAFLIPFHFLSYSRLVFRSRDVSLGGVGRYVVALAVSFVLNVGLVWAYWRIAGADPLSAQVLGLLPAIAANYLMFKFFVFRNEASAALLARFHAHARIGAALGAVAAYAALAALLLIWQLLPAAMELLR